MGAGAVTGQEAAGCGEAQSGQGVKLYLCAWLSEKKCDPKTEAVHTENDEPYPSYSGVCWFTAL